MELREKLAHYARDNIGLFNCEIECPDNAAIEAEAGIDIRFPDYCNYCFANRILAIIKEAGYVKLSDDQSLPENPYDKQIEQAGSEPATEEDVYIMAFNGFERGILAMLRAGFRRVEL